MALPLPDASRRHRSEIYRQSVSFYRVSVIALNDLYGSGDYSDFGCIMLYWQQFKELVRKIFKNDVRNRSSNAFIKW